MFVFIVYIDVDYCVYRLHSRPALERLVVVLLVKISM
jgi:hypothetical protein